MQRAAKAMLFGGVGPWAACLGEVTSSPEPEPS